MIERELFLKRLAEHEDDETIRMVYADWLDDQGEHEEADRQRKWPAAKEWLVQFSEKKSSGGKVFYDQLIEFGRRAAEEERTKDWVYVDDESMWYALKGDGQKFWKNWAIVTGIPLPRSFEDKDFHHWVCCSHEVYYWFGSPDPDEPDVSGE